MQFHWTGSEIVLSSWPDDPKVAALQAHPQVALTLDTTESPFRVLQIRGTAAVTIVAGVSPEMVAAATRYMGPEGGGRGWSRLGGSRRAWPASPFARNGSMSSTSRRACPAAWPGALALPEPTARRWRGALCQTRWFP